MKVQKSTYERAINALIDTHPELSSELETMVKATRAMSRAAQDALLSKQERIAELEAALAAQVATLTRERDGAREINLKLIDATRVDCDVHYGARRECGQCYDSQGQYLKNVTAERDEARAAAARKGERLKAFTEWASTWRHAVVIRAIGADEAWRQFEEAHNEGCAALADTTSEAWLAEVRATARDEALGESADVLAKYGTTWCAAASRLVLSLKRGGK